MTYKTYMTYVTYIYVYIYMYVYTYDIQVRISYRFSEYHGFSAPVLAGMQLGGPGSSASFGISAVPGAADGGSRGLRTCVGSILMLKNLMDGMV